MKILWVNPSFLDYRIPVYKRLYELTGGNFFIVFSQKRVPPRITVKIKKSIGDNAICLSNEKSLVIPGTGKFEDTNLRFPYQPGLYKTISKVDADLIIAEGFFQWTPLALIWAKLAGKKFVIAYERTSHAERNSPKWRIFYRKFISKFVDGYSANGQLTKAYLLRLGINENKIFIGGMSADSENLVNGINSFTITEQQRLKTKLSLQKGLTFLYVGQLTERKGVIYLLEAWQKHVETHFYDNLLILGTGILYNSFNSEFASCTSIKFLGSIDHDSIYSYYAIADVFIIPTLEDNWSLVVPEAMACGLPIACSIYNGCYPELVHENVNGKLFDPLKEESIKTALDYFHGQDLQAMGLHSAIIEKNYNAESVAVKIHQTCETILAKK